MTFTCPALLSMNDTVLLGHGSADRPHRQHGARATAVLLGHASADSPDRRHGAGATA